MFDPLAVLLVISLNITLLRDENDYEIYKKEEKNLTYDEDTLNDRMDIIAQNGNTGEHYEEPDVEDLPEVGDDIVKDKKSKIGYVDFNAVGGSNTGPGGRVR